MLMSQDFPGLGSVATKTQPTRKMRTIPILACREPAPQGAWRYRADASLAWIDFFGSSFMNYSISSVARGPRARSFRPALRVGAGAILAAFFALQFSAASAAPVCSSSPYTSGDLTCTNTGTINTTGTNGMDTNATGGSASATNYGTITAVGNVFGMSTTSDVGNATTVNSGTINLSGNFTGGIATSTDIGAATTTNRGTVNVEGTNSFGISTQAGFGPPTSVPIMATTNNLGTVNVSGNDSRGIGTEVGVDGGHGTTTTNNFGNVNVTGFSTVGIFTQADAVGSGIADAVTNNYGSVTVNGGRGIGIATTASGGNATVINSGIINVMGPNTVGVYMGSTGTSLLVNSGVIAAYGGTAIQFADSCGCDPATLTLLPGSFIIGPIHMLGAGDTVNVFAGNQNLTFNTLSGVTVNGTVPFVVSGNRIASVDPTGFAVTDRSLMDFTHAVSGMLDGRVAGAGQAAGGAGVLGFAGSDDSPSRFDDAFARVLGYAKAPDSTMFFKNPTVTGPDGTTVWAKGFYGQRFQNQDGPILRNVTNFLGGAIGADRLTRPDLRLGRFAGGGAIDTSIDLNMGKVDSDIGFAGVYGRKYYGPAFVDFALLGGYTANRSTRNVNNNLLANGLETATASFGGWFVSPEVATGYHYDFAPGWAVTPAAHLRYLAAGYNGYTESGSTADMTVGSRILQNTEERADVTLTRTMDWNASRLELGLTLGAIGQQRAGSGTVNATLLGQALAFATPGRSDVAGGYVGASADWHMRNGLSLFASTEYQALSDSSSTVTGMAGLRYGF